VELHNANSKTAGPRRRGHSEPTTRHARCRGRNCLSEHPSGTASDALCSELRGHRTYRYGTNDNVVFLCEMSGALIIEAIKPSNH
jgi:hypothetical protein